MPVDFVSHVRAEVERMAKVAAFAQERGYIVAFHWQERLGTVPGQLSPRSMNRVVNMCAEHAETFGKPAPLPLWVALDDHLVAQSKAARSLVLEHGAFRASVGFRLPTTVKYKPVVGALSLVSAESSRNNHNRGTGVLLNWRERSSFHEYWGHGRDPLRAVMSILNMPENRNLLKG